MMDRAALTAATPLHDQLNHAEITQQDQYEALSKRLDQILDLLS